MERDVANNAVLPALLIIIRGKAAVFSAIHRLLAKVVAASAVVPDGLWELAQTVVEVVSPLVMFAREQVRCNGIVRFARGAKLCAGQTTAGMSASRFKRFSAL